MYLNDRSQSNSSTPKQPSRLLEKVPMQSNPKQKATSQLNASSNLSNILLKKHTKAGDYHPAELNSKSEVQCDDGLNENFEEYQDCLPFTDADAMDAPEQSSEDSLVVLNLSSPSNVIACKNMSDGNKSLRHQPAVPNLRLMELSETPAKCLTSNRETQGKNYLENVPLPAVKVR